MSRGVVAGWVSAGLLLLVLLACTRKAVENVYFPLDKGRTWTYSVTPDPIDEGDEPLTLTVTSLGEEEVTGTRVTKEKIDLANEAHYLFVNADEKGVFRYASQSAGDKAPTVEEERDYFLVYPLTLGKSWRGKSAPTFLDVADVAVEIESTVESTTETVHVAAGEFTDVVKISVTGKARIEPQQDDDEPEAGAAEAVQAAEADDGSDAQDDPDAPDDEDAPDEAEQGGTFSLKEQTWYAPNVGVVKSVIEETFVPDSGDEEKARVTTELRSFKR